MTAYAPQDAPRLARLMSCVFEVMASGEWLTLGQIVRECAARGVQAGEASVSARLREARNEHGREVKKERVAPGSGLYRYRIVPHPRAGEQLRLEIA